MPEENISPEERLFKVMQKETSASTSDPEGAGKIGKGVKGPIFAKWQHFLAKLAVGVPRGAAGTQTRTLATAGPLAAVLRLQNLGALKQILVNGIDLNAVNRVCALILVGLVVYIIAAAANQNPSMNRLMQSISKIRFEKAPSQAMEAFQPVDYYLNQVRGRDIFNPAQEAETQVARQEPVVAPPPPKPQIKDLASGLKVVGIAWGESPKAMIEDSMTQGIYFLKEGQKIGKTEIQVKEIRRNKVIIAYNGEEMDL